MKAAFHFQPLVITPIISSSMEACFVPVSSLLLQQYSLYNFIKDSLKVSFCLSVKTNYFFFHFCLTCQVTSSSCSSDFFSFLIFLSQLRLLSAAEQQMTAHIGIPLIFSYIQRLEYTFNTATVKCCSQATLYSVQICMVKLASFWEGTMALTRMIKTTIIKTVKPLSSNAMLLINIISNFKSEQLNCTREEKKK